MELVQLHLEQCPTCQAAHQELLGLDHQLHMTLRSQVPNAAFVEGVTDRLGRQDDEAIGIQQIQVASGISQASVARWRNVLWFSSIATALLVGFLGGTYSDFGGSRKPAGSVLVQNTEVARAPDSAAKLWFATQGNVEVWNPDSIRYLPCPVRSDVVQGARMRTSSEKCELRTPEGATIRMDEDTEVALTHSREVVLEKGRIFLSVPEESSEANMVVHCGDAAVEVAGGVCDVRNNGSATQLIPLEGQAVFSCGDGNSSVSVGQKLAWSAGGKEPQIERASLDPIVETSWLHDILVANEDASEELNERVSRILAVLGYSKLTYLVEDELRSLGANVVEPAIAFVQSDEAEHQNDRERQLAAELIRDLAEYSHVPQLVTLLEHRDKRIRHAAATALERLLGRSIAGTPSQWRDAEPQQTSGWLKTYEAYLESR